MNESKILIIEDHPMNMELTADLLEFQGYQVLRATRAQEGLEMARLEVPDLVLMDIGLPDMDGLEATHILKEDPVTRDIQVLALTAHAMRGDRRKALDAGCDGYITKPINTRIFPEQVAALMQGRRDCCAV